MDRLYDVASLIRPRPEYRLPQETALDIEQLTSGRLGARAEVEFEMIDTVSIMQTRTCSPGNEGSLTLLATRETNLPISNRGRADRREEAR